MSRLVQIVDFPDYSVNEEGVIIKNSNSRTIKQIAHPRSGSMTVYLRRDGAQYCRSVSRIVGRAFNPPQDESWVAVHIDGDIKNNSASNISWIPRPIAIRVARGKDPLFKREVTRLPDGVTYENEEVAARAVSGVPHAIAKAARSNGMVVYAGFQWVYKAHTNSA